MLFVLYLRTLCPTKSNKCLLVFFLEALEICSYISFYDPFHKIFTIAKYELWFFHVGVQIFHIVRQSFLNEMPFIPLLKSVRRVYVIVSLNSDIYSIDIYTQF